MLLKQNKSKVNILQKKNSLQTMPMPPATSAPGKNKLEEKRTDSCQTRNRLIKKFNSISPKMQDAIAKGLSMKPIFVDPNKLENKEVKAIPEENLKAAGDKDLEDYAKMS